MPVKVKTGMPNPREVTHDNGENSTVKDGHLYVYDGRHAAANVVAIYAPGQWLHAQVVDKQE